MPPPRSDSGRRGGDPRPVVAPGLSAPPGTPLYVHVPFCVVKCSYCDFFSVAADETSDLAGTVDAILSEAQARGPEAPESVFLGGGTPTYLPAEELVRLLEGLDRATGFREAAREVTVECNPESLTLEKARAMRAAGVDRLSIGVQSLEPRILELFGRPHDAEEAFSAYAAAREAGFRRVSIDVIYGVPGQRLERWLQDLDRLLDLGPDHVSAYSLAFEEGTPLTHDLARGRLERLDEELELAFLRETRRRLGERGWGPYEVSNFASNSSQRCLHNQNAWRNGPYVGLGPGAVSKLERTRFGNPRSVLAWRRAIEAGEAAASWEETRSAVGEQAETWWLGLRTTEGVDATGARRRAADGGSPVHPEEDPFELLATDLGAQGFLERAGAHWRLTERGLPLADALSARFLTLTEGTPVSGAGSPPVAE